uniref:CUB domain-containing protein n=1 Tax=Plectus sambesii TaxID=2011161 RepID=A0A914XQU2_9BILA
MSTSVTLGLTTANPAASSNYANWEVTCNGTLCSYKLHAPANNPTELDAIAIKLSNASSALVGFQGIYDEAKAEAGNYTTLVNGYIADLMAFKLNLSATLNDTEKKLSDARDVLKNLQDTVYNATCILSNYAAIKTCYATCNPTCPATTTAAPTTRAATTAANPLLTTANVQPTIAGTSVTMPTTTASTSKVTTTTTSPTTTTSTTTTTTPTTTTSTTTTTTATTTTPTAATTPTPRQTPTNPCHTKNCTGTLGFPGTCSFSGNVATCQCPGNLDPDSCGKVGCISKVNGGQVVNQLGPFWSPNYNGNSGTYDGNLDCLWIMQPPQAGQTINITVLAFKTGSDATLAIRTKNGYFPLSGDLTDNLALINNRLQGSIAGSTSVTFEFTNTNAGSPGDYFKIGFAFISPPAT